MAKRKTTDTSDAEEEYSSDHPAPASRSKRPRPSSEGPDPTQGTQPGKGTRMEDDESEEEQMDVDADKENETPSQKEAREQEERAIEEMKEAAIRESIETQGKKKGGIAEHGIIQDMELVNFMCHPLLTLNFGPQINFIIGHNGSGKSAVLSGLTVALGGKATSTGRGSGLKSFIKEGETWAEATIKIKNEGSEAYKPEVYGPSIIITRRIVKDGSASYKIKNHKDKVVSSKKEDLSAVLDHMGIQVDNPLNVLTQDTSRQFLAAATAIEKYQFFLKGTQLTQLSDEYEMILENIQKASKALDIKAAGIPDLEKAFNDAALRFQNSEKAQQLSKKLDQIKEELCWALVAGKIEEADKAQADYDKAASRVAKYDPQIAVEEGKVAEAEAMIQELDPAVEEGQQKDLRKQRETLNLQIRAQRNKLAGFKNEQEQFGNSLNNCNEQIQHLQAQIDTETQKLQEDHQGKREEMTRRINELKALMEAKDQEIQALIEKSKTYIREKAEAEQEGRSAEKTMDQHRETIVGHDHMLRGLQAQKINKLHSFGNRIPEVLQLIQREQWRGEMPVGPLGMFVEVKDQQWAHLMRLALGGLMSSWAVSDVGDRGRLNRILESCGNRGTQIIASTRDIFDYSSGEPHPSALTALRMLKISDEWVTRILINQSHIERVRLAVTRNDADELANRNRGSLVWSGDGFRILRYPEGGVNSQSLGLKVLRGGDPRAGLFKSADIDGEIRATLEQKQQVEGAVQALTNTVKESKLRWKAKHDLNVQCERETTRRQAEHRDLSKQLDALKLEAQEEAPASITALESVLEETQTEKEGILTNFKNAVAAEAEVSATIRPLVEEVDQIRHQLEQLENERSALLARLTAAAEQKLQAESNKAHYAKKKKEEENKAATLQKALEKVQKEVDEWAVKAEEYCPRFENPRPKLVVEKEKKTTEDALKDRERRVGASAEEIAADLKRAEAVLEHAKKEVKGMQKLNKIMKQAMWQRATKWEEFRKAIAMRCKITFQYHLSNRGYHGKVLFDHKNGTLNIRVQTDDQIASSGSREKDVKSLSGGEKSFSTICLLLSLWDAIGCPIRCLDEFDVFMDAVNRRISMKMMIDTAKSSDKRQYILITPLDISASALGPEVRILRMRDPERNQAVLPFN